MELTKYARDREYTVCRKWLESVRKDVECFFGRVKGRFRILKLPLLFRSQGDIDNMFFTCCILHKMLHSFDGLGELEEDVHWAGLDGHHDAWVVNPATDETSVGQQGERTNDVASRWRPRMTSCGGAWLHR